MTPIEVLTEFIHRLNQHDVDRTAAMMTEDHLFVDSLGNAIRGRETMRAGWRGYFSMCPDYRITCEHLLTDGTLVVALGSAGGAIAVRGDLLPENKWSIPAAWRTLVEGGLVKEWQVYADNKPVYDILARAKAPGS